MSNEPRRAQAGEGRDVTTLEAAMNHAREMRARLAADRSPTLTEPHVVLMPETEVEYVSAEKALQQSLRANKQMEAIRAEMDEQRYLYFVRCERQVNRDRSPHQGVYIAEPFESGVVPAGKWWATYLEKGQRYQVGMVIICQQCEKDGHPCALPVELDGKGGFTVDLMHIWKVPRDYDEYLVEGASRALDLPYASGNMWREAHMKKVEKALEVRRAKLAAKQNAPKAGVA